MSRTSPAAVHNTACFTLPAAAHPATLPFASIASAWLLFAPGNATSCVGVVLPGFHTTARTPRAPIDPPATPPAALMAAAVEPLSPASGANRRIPALASHT